MIDEIVTNWLNDCQADLVDNYNKIGVRASGNWEQELETYNRVQPFNIVAGIKGAPYTQFPSNGRNPNKNQSEEAIRKWVGWAGSTFIKKWVEDKGLDLSPYAVAAKIAKKGWEVPNRFNPGGLVDGVITDTRIKLLTDNIIGGMIKELRSDVLKQK